MAATIQGDYSGNILTVCMTVASVFTTGNAKKNYKVPCDCMLMEPVTATLQTIGTSAGSTNIMIRNSTDSKDLLTSAISIGTHASNYTAEGELVGATSQNTLRLDDGDVLCVDIDSVTTGGTEKDLSVYLYLKCR